MARALLLLSTVLMLLSGCTSEPDESPHFVPAPGASADRERPVKPLRDVPPPTKIQMH